MKCPYCNKEMRRGYIRTINQKLLWTPEEEGFLNSGSVNSLPLGKFSRMDGAKVTAYYCKECEKIIVDTKQ